MNHIVFGVWTAAEATTLYTVLAQGEDSRLKVASAPLHLLAANQVQK